MLVNDSGKWKRKTETLNPIKLAVIQLWQAGLIMQHKGKTNRLYLRRVVLFIMPTAIAEQITAGSQVQPIHFLSTQSFTLVPFITCRVAALIYGLDSVLCKRISRHRKMVPNISLCGPPCRYFPKRRCTGPYFSSHWVRSRNSATISLAHSHLSPISLTAPFWKTGSPGGPKCGETIETAHWKARGFPTVRQQS